MGVLIEQEAASKFRLNKNNKKILSNRQSLCCCLMLLAAFVFLIHQDSRNLESKTSTQTVIESSLSTENIKHEAASGIKDHQLKIIVASLGTSGTHGIKRVLCGIGLSAHHWHHLCPKDGRIYSPAQNLFLIAKTFKKMRSADDLDKHVLRYQTALLEDIRVLKSSEAS